MGMEGREEESQGDKADTSSQLGRRGGGDTYRPHSLINTHRLGAEPQKALLLVYSAPQYQGHVVVSAPPQEERRSGRDAAPHQLLNPSALLPHQAVPDPTLRPPPSLLLCRESVLQVWGEAGGGDCCETTFIEDASSPSCAAAASPSQREALLFADGRFVDVCGEEAKIPSLSYDIDEDEDDDDFQELEVINNFI